MKRSKAVNPCSKDFTGNLLIIPLKLRSKVTLRRNLDISPACKNLLKIQTDIDVPFKFRDVSHNENNLKRVFPSGVCFDSCFADGSSICQCSNRDQRSTSDH